MWSIYLYFWMCFTWHCEVILKDIGKLTRTSPEQNTTKREPCASFSAKIVHCLTLWLASVLMKLKRYSATYVHVHFYKYFIQNKANSQERCAQVFKAMYSILLTDILEELFACEGNMGLLRKNEHELTQFIYMYTMSWSKKMYSLTSTWYPTCPSFPFGTYQHTCDICCWIRK